jgi:flavin reductase (DIM6/NTAB) family NADH-FMN oxidoreductase RutF
MQVMRLAPGVAGGANVVVGEIVHLYVHDDILDEDLHVLPERLPVIGRLGGLGYCTIRDRFDLPRGRAALAPDDP